MGFVLYHQRDLVMNSLHAEKFKKLFYRYLDCKYTFHLLFFVYLSYMVDLIRLYSFSSGNSQPSCITQTHAATAVCVGLFKYKIRLWSSLTISEREIILVLL